ncbi:MAG: type I restriction-modification system subunit M N-terminal domain-containing protein [Anaerolineae bacterium]|nr:type I restriction-modification system subunit M N-terminal domain-containing protein [Anaerolineae bacterium]
MEQPSTFERSLTLYQLASQLWEAADILRGSLVERSIRQTYLFLRLFFKHICDVWDEEDTGMVAIYGVGFADEPCFREPETGYWNVVRETPTGIGTALQNALRCTETTNQEYLHKRNNALIAF